MRLDLSSGPPTRRSRGGLALPAGRAGGLFLGLSLFALGSLPGTAAALPGGIAATGCSGCHRGGSEPEVTVSVDNASVDPGDTVTLTVSIQNTNGQVGGFYITDGGTGQFSLLSGEQTRLAGAGVTHSSPKRSASGPVEFRVRWTAPNRMGGVGFEVAALSADGSNGARGDEGGAGTLAFAFGCAGGTYYRDNDEDGYGGDFGRVLVDCAAPDGFAPERGDCNDNNELVNPAATEICNLRDDDCDGNTDEGVDTVMLCEDSDGDGYGVSTGSMVEGCGEEGFGPCGTDCNDTDPNTHRDAEEVCNLFDDDCDGRVDERVRPTCGLGWCQRLALTCEEPLICTPGEPRVEVCNDYDDDCDGIPDNGSDLELCGERGLVCRGGRCIPEDEAPPEMMSGPDGGVRNDAGRTTGGTGGASGGCQAAGLTRGAATPVVLTVLLFAWMRRRRRAAPSTERR